MKKVLSFSNDTFILEEIGENGKILSEERFTTFTVAQIKNDKTVTFGIKNTDKIIKFDEFLPSWTISQRFVFLNNDSWLTIFDMNDILSITVFSKKIVIGFNNNSGTVFYFPTSDAVINEMKNFLNFFPNRSIQFQIEFRVAFVCCLDDLEKETTKSIFENIKEIANFVHKNKNKNYNVKFSSPYGYEITNNIVDKCLKFNGEQTDNNDS